MNFIYQISLIIFLVTLTFFPLSSNGQTRTVDYTGSYEDITIPDNTDARNYISVTLKGGDGGKRRIGSIIGKGGGGAKVEASFEIGTGIGELKPGGKLRFIVGHKGTRNETGEVSGSGGGGGTGILYTENPDDVDCSVVSTDIADANSCWVLLAAAAGGGGAYGSGFGASSGKNGRAQECGGDAGLSQGGNGGCNGNGGQSLNGFPGGRAGGGGGAKSDGTTGNSVGGAEGKKGGFEGGAGGDDGGDKRTGGFGYGGGGAGEKGALNGRRAGGGGGGGYSGGGSGDTAPGAGGGSFVNSAALIYEKKDGKADGSPDNGRITYFYEESINAVQAKCKDLEITLLNGSYTLQAEDIDNGSQAETGESIEHYLFPGLKRSITFTCANLGETSLPLVVLSTSGLADECTSIIEILEDTQPTVVCSTTPITPVVAPGENFVLDPNSIVVSASDDCGSVSSVFLAKDVFSCTDVGANTIMVYAEDESGNVGSCAYSFNVGITEPIPAVCQNITVASNASCQAVVEASQIYNGSYDNCGVKLALSQDIIVAGLLVTTVPATSLTLSGAGTHTVELIVGETTTTKCNATVTLVAVAPIANCHSAITVALDDQGQGQITVDEVNNGSTYYCAIASFDRFLPETVLYYTCENLGENLLTLYLRDPSGNEANCNTIITVIDNTAPSANCNTEVEVILNEQGLGQLSVDAVNNGSISGCGQALTFSFSEVDFQENLQYDCVQEVEEVATLYVWDENGNSSSCQATVTLIDNQMPAITCPVDQSVSTDTDQCSALFQNLEAPVYNDNCDVSLSYDVTGTPIGSFSSYSTEGVGVLSELLVTTGSAKITYVATDSYGNVGQCSFSLTVEDTQSPAMTCPESFTVSTLEDDCLGSASWTHPAVTDNCPTFVSDVALNLFYELTGATTIGPISVGDLNGQSGVSTKFNLGVTTISYSFNDLSGNSTDCNFTITVVDEVSPVSACKETHTIWLATDGLATLTSSDIDNGSTDNCGSLTLSLSQTSFGCEEVGENTVTLTVTDVTGNTNSCSATVTVQDSVAPIALCQNTTIQLDDNGEASISTTDIDNGSNDACGVANLSLNNLFFGCEEVGENTVTLTVTDVTGNTNSCSATVTVQDSVAPIALCQNTTIQLDDNGEASISTTDIDNGSNDACGVANLSLNNLFFGCEEVGDNTVTLTVIDVNGNDNSCTATVTVQDLVAPIALCQNTTIQLDDNGETSISTTDIDNGSNDACGIANISLNNNSFGCGEVGGNTVTLTVIDVNGNDNSCTATVTVQDLVAPIALCQNTTIQLDDNGEASISTTDIDNGSNDACGIANIFLNNNSFDCEEVGDNTVTLTVIDVNGNANSCTATVTVQDLLIPNALCQNTTVQLDGNGEASISTTDIDNGSNDVCGVGNISLNTTSFGCEEVGDNTVTLTVIDVNGNASTCQAMVTVLDEIAPTLTCPQSLTVNTDPGECGADVTLPKAAPADNCSIKNLKSRYRALDAAGVPVGSWSAWASDHSDFFELGSYEIEWRATDSSDNQAFCNFTLDIIDEEAPEVICKDVTINFNGEGTIIVPSTSVFDEVASFDACGTVAFVSQSISEVSCENVGETLAVQVVGVDPNGNISSCTAQVSVVGMPCDFEATDIDCTDGATASYDPVEESFTLTANDCSGYPHGEYSLVKTELCGDGEIIAHVASLSGDGRVGLIMMENADAEARFVSIIKDLTSRTRTEYRTSTGGNISFKKKHRPGVDWLKIVRNGNRFKTYTSSNGNFWRLAHSITFSNFEECINAGLVLYTKYANVPVTAVFDQVKVTGDNYNAFTQLPDGPANSVGEKAQQIVPSNLQPTIRLDVAPNPFATRTRIDFTLVEEADVTLEIYNLQGQGVQRLENTKLDAGNHRYQWDGTSDNGQRIPSGIYLIQLRTNDAVISKKVLFQRD